MQRYTCLVCGLVLSSWALGVVSAEPLIRQAKRAWGPEQATGAPDTPGAGDQTTAWASATPDGQDEWLELEYDEPVLAEMVVIHETYNPGAVVKVIGYTESGMDAELWSGRDPTPRGTDKGVSEIPLKGKLETKRIRLHIASKEVAGWNEIDAVGLKDAKGKIHWAVAAKASSIYGAGAALGGGAFGFIGPAAGPVAVDGGLIVPAAPAFVKAIAVAARPVGKGSWSPEQATGEPDTKLAGDYSTAWASATPDGADEWLEVEFAEAVKIETVQIHETYNPGAVHKVTGYNDAGKEEDLWEGKDPTDSSKEMGVSDIPVKGKLKTNRLRIYLNSKDVPGWNEIDAVAIKDAAGKTQWAKAAKASSTFGAGGFGFLIEGDAAPVPVVPAPVVPAPVVPAAPVAPRPAAFRPAARPDPRDARIEKLEQEVSDLKKSLDEIRKLLEKPR